MLRAVITMCLLVTAAPATTLAQFTEEPPDTTMPRVVPAHRYSPFDSISARGFHAAHPFSFDQFLEFLSGTIVSRQGPIGGRATYSRFGIGRGRGSVYLGAIELNDPQDGLAPLALVPTTAVGRILRDRPQRGRLSIDHGIEGSLRVEEPMPSAGTPFTAFDVAKAEVPREINRRVRFSSASGRVGGDFSYDELQSNGYSFDARSLVRGRDYGRSATRMQSGAIRGRLGSEDYRVEFRDFESSFQGDASDFTAEYRRSGFIAALESTVRRLDFVLYARSYKVSAPDSLTNNTTTGIRANIPLVAQDNRDIRLHLAWDDIGSAQYIGGGSSEDRLQIGEAAVSGFTKIGRGRDLSFNFDLAQQFDYAATWGAGALLNQNMGERHRLTLHGKRGYRLPTIGELFLPFHSAGGNSFVGHRNLAAEGSLEVGARLYSGSRRWSNDLRATALRVNPILPIVVSTSPGVLLSPRNVDAQSIQVIEDRFDANGSLWQFDLLWSGGAGVSFGTREGYFEGVPRVHAVTTASVGRDLFERTSGVVLTAEYQYGAERKDGGNTMPSYGVLNLKLDVRLVEFRAYFLILNFFDEAYQTAYPFLMTPRTFVYGAFWAFDS